MGKGNGMAQDTLAGFVEATATKLGVPGVAVGVWADGRESYACHGVTNIDNKGVLDFGVKVGKDPAPKGAVRTAFTIKPSAMPPGSVLQLWVYNVHQWDGTPAKVVYGVYDLVTQRVCPLPPGGPAATSDPCFGEAPRRADDVTELGARVVQRILALHREFDVRLCVSIAQLAGRVFLHHFLTHPIPAPPREVLRAALLSYHGGKNGFYLPAPAWVPQCREYDLRSAYPWAMTQIPSMSQGHWKKVTYVDADLWGFYQVSGTVPQDPYPALYDDTFRPLGPGRVDGDD